MLPRSLRQAFAHACVPPAVAADLGLAPTATAAALGPSAWSHIDALPDRVVEFLVGLVVSRPARELRVMADPWPAEIQPGDVLWPTRLGRALRRGNLLTPDRLEQLTFGQLLAIPAAGPRSALELGVIVDALAAAPAGPLGTGTLVALVEAAGREWAARVASHDPRFRDVLPPYPGRLDRMLAAAIARPGGRLARALAHALPGVTARVEALDGEPLDVAVVGLCEALGVSRRDLAVATVRLDRSSGRPPKLRDVGHRFSVSKERARQITDRTAARLDRSFLPQVDRAGRLLARRAPLRAVEAARLLTECGLSTGPFDPVSVAALAELTGYPAGFAVDAGGGTPLVVPPDLVIGGLAMETARRLARRDGPFSSGQVASALPDVPHDDRVEAVVSLVLLSAPAVAHLDGDWFWIPGHPGGRKQLANVARRMLAVTLPLSLATVRRGVIRQRHGLRLAEVPPEVVLAAYFTAHPDFVLEDDAVRPARPLDPGALLTTGEQALVATLRAAPGGHLNRADLERGARARGVDSRQFASLITYTPVVEHPGRDQWRLCR